ncbi:MAG TPA: protein translocase subunit SecD, partial [Caulobacteraceae bacterium]
MLNLSRWKIILVVSAVIFGILFALPNMLPAKTLGTLPGWMPKKVLNLGLDLQGGSYLLLEVDTTDLRKEKLTSLVEDTRQTLRTNQIEFTDLGVVNGDVMVRIVDPAKVDAAYRNLNKLAGATRNGAPDMTVSRTGDQRLRLAYAPEALSEQASSAVEQSIEIIRRRIDPDGNKEIPVTRQGEDRIVVQAPGESDPERLKNLIGQTAKLTFQMVDETVTPQDVAEGRIPPGSVVLPSTDGYSPAYVVKRRALV